MIPIIIRLPHKLKENKNINVSPFHRWEHIFVRILQNIYKNRGLPIYASTCSRDTKIMILFERFELSEIQKNIKVLRRKVPSNLVINSEIEIINNELACLANIYHEKNQICENGTFLSKEELLDFRKNAYNWKGISIEEPVKEERVKLQVTQKSPQLLIAQIREYMMEKLDKDIEITMIRSVNSFIIYRFRDNSKIPKFTWRKALTNMDAVDGYLLQKLRNHLALSFMIWPTWEEREEFTGLQIFTFLKIKNIDYFYEMICKWIFEFMQRHEIERDIIEGVLKTCQVSVMDEDNIIKKYVKLVGIRK